jgi:hypothetical protein
MHWRRGQLRRTYEGVSNLLGVDGANSLLLLVSTIFIGIVHGTFFTDVDVVCR